jgi:uridine kinase
MIKKNETIKKIIKRDGKIVDFDRRKITFAILQAAIAVGGRDKEIADRITNDVIGLLEKRTYKETYPSVEEVQDLVEKCLIEHGHAKTAKAYILYRYEHALRRMGKQSLTYSSENIPYKKLWQALSWAVDCNCVRLSQLHYFTGEKKVEELVRMSEKFYSSEIEYAVGEIEKRRDDIRIIIVAGPSSSGKTTTTIKIHEILKKKGFTLIPLAVDNYFFDLNRHPKDATGDYDFETPQALDIHQINGHIRELLDGGEIQVPKYNFKKGMRDGYSRTLRLKENEILLIDSLHGMYEEMIAGIAGENKFKLYVETLSQLKDKDEKFVRWSDIRMLRRMVRDKQFRNYNPGQTIAHWRYVRRSELRYIISKLTTAHVIVNSYLAYELPVLKSFLFHLFPGFIREFKQNSEFEDAYERASRVYEFLSQVPEWTNLTVIPAGSLLREFIGGSIYNY